MENLNEAKVSDEWRLCYGIVGNIPKEFRSADLRAMFSNFIEAKGFDCFHFRHRPEFRRNTDSNSGDDCFKSQESSTTCCVVSIVERKLQEFIKCYHGKNWVDRNGKYFPSKTVISKVRSVEENDSCEYKSYKTRKEKRQIAVTRTNMAFSSRDLKEMPELHPPHLMPNGNVGTQLSVFMELIRTCQLPPRVIKKLGLNFPSNKFKKKYSNVPLDYKSLEKVTSPGVQSGHLEKKGGREPKVQHAAAELDSFACGDVQNPDFFEVNKSTYRSTAHSNDEKHPPDLSEVNKSTYRPTAHSNEDKHPDILQVNKNTYQSSGHSDNEKHPESDDDSSVEEWDRHEALHNDVTSQERTKERLFEEEIELKWEKGGSGLVFYTDAAFWKQQEEADFDEETVDDWDVDMEIYENPDGGDKDSRDLLQMRLESQWRKGNDIDLNKIGDFEKHTRGFGGQLMRQQGWKEGASLGSSQVGITEPVHADGQLPTCKRGIGYYGEKLQRHVKRPRAERSVIISTVYDKPDEYKEDLFHSWGPDRLKYINSVDFVCAKSLPKNTGTGQTEV